MAAYIFINFMIFLGNSHGYCCTVFKYIFITFVNNSCTVAEIPSYCENVFETMPADFIINNKIYIGASRFQYNT